MGLLGLSESLTDQLFHHPIQTHLYPQELSQRQSVQVLATQTENLHLHADRQYRGLISNTDPYHLGIKYFYSRARRVQQLKVDAGVTLDEAEAGGVEVYVHG